jgi:hypothetical protein
MAALPSSITINDGTATPVAVTYTPISASNGNAVFADKRKVAKAFWPKITYVFDAESRSRASDHVSVEVEYPMTKTVDGVELVYATAWFKKGVFILPSGMSQQDRKHLRALVVNGQGVTQYVAMVNDLDPMFA